MYVHHLQGRVSGSAALSVRQQVKAGGLAMKTGNWDVKCYLSGNEEA